MLKNNYILKIVFYKGLYVILNYHLHFSHYNNISFSSVWLSKYSVEGFLKRTLHNLLPEQQILAVIIASLIFGITYFQGKIIALSTIYGFFYGYAYYKTGKIFMLCNSSFRSKFMPCIIIYLSCS